MNLRLLLATLATAVFLSCGTEQITTTDLRCEYRVEPLGIDNTAPRLSWRIESEARGVEQVAYQVIVASSLDRLNNNVGDLWDSGRVESRQSVNNRYGGSALLSGEECYWKVRTWSNTGAESEWSCATRFTMGLLNAEDWRGEWIHRDGGDRKTHNWYRRNVELDAEATSAFVYIASFGYHELYVNGEKVTDNVMNPAQTFYAKRVSYITYDIKDYLTAGDNVIAIWHGAGWSRWYRVSEYPLPPFAFKAQAHIKSGGVESIIATDDKWLCKSSNSSYNSSWDVLDFGGEVVDDRRCESDWNCAEYDDSEWESADIYVANTEKGKVRFKNVRNRMQLVSDIDINTTNIPITATLSAQMVEPQVKYEQIDPVAVSELKDGSYRIDMGVNYTGTFEIDLRGGEEGDEVTFEISDQIGTQCAWAQRSQYIFGKGGKGRFENRFNYAAGRWITIKGLSYKPELKDIRGYVLTSNRRRVSQFESSNELLNKIYEANIDTYIANTVDGILVDCPHRERRGWGEVTVAAMYGDALPNFESGAYMDQYTQFMRDAQLRDGQVRGVINEQNRQFLMWQANNPITIWENYRIYADKKMLEDNYSALTKWMDWLYDHSNYESGGYLKMGKQGTREFPGLGDWCTPKGKFWDSSNSPEATIFNNCLYAYMLNCARQSAEALGKDGDAAKYADRLRVQRKAIHDEFYDAETGRYGGGQQVDQAFALLAGVTPAAERDKVEAALEQAILYNFPYYDTGSSGQALYTRYFIESGERMDLIYTLLTDTCHPSYGYFIETGANVWPERWSGVGNSRIHTCYTGIGGYFINGFGGIRPDPEAWGMQNFIIKPSMVGDLTYANTSFESMYGEVVVNWSRSAGGAKIQIRVPANTSAKVFVPAVSREVVMESGVAAESAEGVEYIGEESSKAVGNYIIYRVGSGEYNFSITAPLPAVEFPDPQYEGDNLAMIARMNASSMTILTEKDPDREAFNLNDEDSETFWKAAGVENEWIEAEWLKPQTFTAVEIYERGDYITSYELQYLSDGEWVTISSGERCGATKRITFDAVTSQKCRLRIISAVKPAEITEFKIIKK